MRDWFQALENLDGSSTNTRLPPLMIRISMSYDEKFNLCTCFLNVSVCSFLAFWQAENLISAQPHIRQQIVCSKRFWIYLCWNYKNLRSPALSDSYYY